MRKTSAYRSPRKSAGSESAMPSATARTASRRPATSCATEANGPRYGITVALAHEIGFSRMAYTAPSDAVNAQSPSLNGATGLVA